MKTADHKNIALDWLKPEIDDAWNFTLMPTNLRIVHELITYYKNPDYVLQGGSHGFEGISPLWPPLPGKAIKKKKKLLFFLLHQKLCLHVSTRHWWTQAQFWQQAESQYFRWKFMEMTVLLNLFHL